MDAINELDGKSLIWPRKVSYVRLYLNLTIMNVAFPILTVLDK